MQENGRKCQRFGTFEFVATTAAEGRGGGHRNTTPVVLQIGLKAGEKASFIHRKRRAAG
jgi:hypothetical protein